jgi:hypothetical protein
VTVSKGKILLLDLIRMRTKAVAKNQTTKESRLILKMTTYRKTRVMKSKKHEKAV